MRKRVLDFLAVTIATSSIVIGVLVMLAWKGGYEPLLSVLPGRVAMQFNTALLFTLTGIAMLLRSERAKPVYMFVAGFAFLTLMQDATGIAFDIDHAFEAPWYKTAAPSAGRMAPGTAMGFIIIGWTMAARRLTTFAGIVLGLTAARGLLTVAGYTFDAVFLYQITPSVTAMAVHTAGLFVALGLACWWQLHERGNADDHATPAPH